MGQKTVLITGASRGIGRSIAEKLLDEGHRVVGIARRECPIDHENFTGIQLDLGLIKLLPSALKKLSCEYPEIDAIVSNAGQGLFGNLEELSYDKIHELININLLSHVFLIKAYIPLFKKRQAGDVLLIGSEAALEGKRKGSVYCASKFAIRGFSQALRDECANQNIRVTLINPGMVQTSFFERLSFRHEDTPAAYIEPSDIANAVSLVLNTRTETNFDEINLTPRKTQVVKKSTST